MAKKQPKKQPKQQPTVADKNITGLEETLGAEFHDILEELGKLSTELEKACSRVANRSNAGTVEYTEIDDIMAKIDEMFMKSDVIRNARIENKVDIDQLIDKINKSIQTRLTALSKAKGLNDFQKLDIEARRDEFLQNSDMNQSKAQLDAMESYRISKGEAHHKKALDEANKKLENETKKRQDFVDYTTRITEMFKGKEADPVGFYTTDIAEAQSALDKIEADIKGKKPEEIAKILVDSKAKLKELITKQGKSLVLTNQAKMLEFYKRANDIGGVKTPEELLKLLEDMKTFISPLAAEAKKFSGVTKEQLDEAVAKAEAEVKRLEATKNMFAKSEAEPETYDVVDTGKLSLARFGVDKEIDLVDISGMKADEMSPKDAEAAIDSIVNGMSEEDYQKFRASVEEKNGIKRGFFEPVRAVFAGLLGKETRYQQQVKMATKLELQQELMDIGYQDRTQKKAEAAHEAWELSEQEKTTFDRNARKIVLDRYERDKKPAAPGKVLDEAANETKKDDGAR